MTLLGFDSELCQTKSWNIYLYIFKTERRKLLRLRFNYLKNKLFCALIFISHCLKVIKDIENFIFENSQQCTVKYLFDLKDLELLPNIPGVHNSFKF
jgi:hypothetical protein